MVFIRCCFLLYLFVNISTAYNIKNALRLGEERADDDETVAFVFANPLDLPEKPALRHHIAHFCPDLAIARQCIQACMERGKVAFCGKDHICYCNHKYSIHDSNRESVADDAHHQFRDLYLKYFGDPNQ